MNKYLLIIIITIIIIMLTFLKHNDNKALERASCFDAKLANLSSVRQSNNHPRFVPKWVTKIFGECKNLIAKYDQGILKCSSPLGLTCFLVFSFLLNVGDLPAECHRISNPVKSYVIWRWWYIQKSQSVLGFLPHLLLIGYWLICTSFNLAQTRPLRRGDNPAH